MTVPFATIGKEINMAKGSVRKKGKKWYYRFYVEDESGNSVQKEFPGTESKSETEALLRKAMADYEEKQFVAKNENITLGDLLDKWLEEEVRPGQLSNGTLSSYQAVIKRIKKHPISNRKLKKLTPDHLQSYLDLLSLGGENPDGTIAKPLSVGYMGQVTTVLKSAFRFAVFPKQFITFNPMQYVIYRKKKEEYALFADSETAEDVPAVPTISCKQFAALNKLLRETQNPALLPIQIAYYTGLRIGEACALTWQDINLKEQYITVRRSIRYNSARRKVELGPTKRKKIRTVDFCDTLAAILREAKKEQLKNRFACGLLYSKNYYTVVQVKNRTYYEVYSLPITAEVPQEYQEVSFVCLRQDGKFESPMSVSAVCRKAKEQIEGMEDFHFHLLRHTFTSNLLSYGASPKDVQELLGHSDVATTMNVYAHASKEAKRTSARLLDKVQ